MNKCVRNYEKLVQLYGQDKATWQHAETPSEMRRRRLQNSGNMSCSPYSVDTINDIDFMVFQNEANLENVCENENIASHSNEVEDEASPLNQPSQFEAPSSPKHKRGRRCDSHDELNLSMAVESVANAIFQSTNAMIQTSNAAIEKSAKILEKCVAHRDPLKDFNVWGKFKDIGITLPIFRKAYVFLFKDPKILECGIRCLDEDRKSLLLDLVGCDHQSRN